MNSLETLKSHNKSHNDIKPQNYLVKFPENKSDLNNIEIVLTDFGMAGPDTKGGTPIFSSPESYAEKERKINVDVFSLGRVFLFLILTDKQFLEFLYIPMDKFEKKEIKNIIESDGVLTLIIKMMISNPKNRVIENDSLQYFQKRSKNLTFENIKKISRIVETVLCTEINAYVENLKNHIS